MTNTILFSKPVSLLLSFDDNDNNDNTVEENFNSNEECQVTLLYENAEIVEVQFCDGAITSIKKEFVDIM